MKVLLKLSLLIVILFLAVVPAFAQQPPCSNLIVNGSFEEDGGWHWELTPKPPTFTQDAAWDGSRSMLLGNLDPSTDTLAFSSVWQDITVPADASSVKLTFHYKLVSQGQQAFDEAKFVLLNPADGSILAVPWREKQDTAGGWEEVTIDLTSLTRGQTIRFYFGVVNDGNGNPTAMYLDDVRLMVCTGYAPLPTPTPMPAVVTPTPVPAVATPTPTVLLTPTFTPALTPTTPITPASLPLISATSTPTPQPKARPAVPITAISIVVVILGAIVILLIAFIVLRASKGRGKAKAEGQSPQKSGGQSAG
jgi:hypothetical protein